MRIMYQSEVDRIYFYIRRDGMEETIRTAQMIMKVYRKSILRSRKRGFDKPHHFSLTEYRRNVIMSYLQLKDFIKTPELYDIVVMFENLEIKE